MSFRTTIVGSLLLALSAQANVGLPYFGGNAAGQPAGIRDIAIEREVLTIDMRPLADGGLVQVEAIYHLNNAGAEKQLKLLFAAGSDAEHFQVMLDDHVLPHQVDPPGRLPENWQSPRATPQIPGRGSEPHLAYRPRTKLVAFTAMIPSGPHILRATYAGEAGTHLFGDPTVYRQFAYVLAPARSWDGFGSLELTIHVPAGWYAATNVDLQRDGDTLSGRFSKIPADALSITVQASEGPRYKPVVYGSFALLVLVVVGGLVASWFIGRRLGRRVKRPDYRGRGYWGTHAWPWSLVWALTWALLTFGAGLVAMLAPDWALPKGQSSHYGYGQAFAIIGIALLAAVLFPIGFVVTQITAVVTAGSTRPQ